MASLTTGEMQYQLDHASENRSGNIIAAVVTCLCLAFIAVGLRIFSRRLKKTPLGADDWMIFVALVRTYPTHSTTSIRSTDALPAITKFFNVVYATINLLGVHFGFGRHQILLKHPVSAAKVELATEILYNPAMITVKLSILLLYNRIFPNQKFRLLLWAVAAFIFCYTVAGTFVVLFQCAPVRAVWDPSIKHRCVNLDAELIAIGVLNSVTDVVILGLPVPFLWRLHSSLAHKIQLAGMFSLGGFVCITSIVRVIAVSSISLTDGTWVNAYPAIWAFVETSIAVVSACLPTLRPVYRYTIFGRQGLLGQEVAKDTSDPMSDGSKAIRLTKSVESWRREQKRERVGEGVERQATATEMV